MTIYNILFPFLILVALGIAIFILTKHLPEAAQHDEILDKEEKKRWWQVLLGKGENILRSLRVLILRLDNKLNDSIKKVRERKEEMGQGLREYGDRNRNKFFGKNKKELEKEAPREEFEPITADEPAETEVEGATEEEVEKPETDTEQEEKAGVRKKVTSFFHKPKEVRNRQVEEILKKTFTPTELKVEKEQYWKKKEEMLIQSIVRDPRNVGLYLQLGRLYSTQHNWKDARNAFLEVLKLDKTNVKAKEELKRIDKNLNE